MADSNIPNIDPFQAMAASRLAADEREYKAKVIAEIAALKALVTELITKFETKESKSKKE